MQGWRISMEDAHTTVLDLLADKPEEAKGHPQKLSFFGVFDGHGGSTVALFAGENIHHIIAKQDTFKSANYEQALKDGFLATDRAILNGTEHASLWGVACRVSRVTSSSRRVADANCLADPKYEEEVSGCTACVGLISNDKIYIVRAPISG